MSKKYQLKITKDVLHTMAIGSCIMASGGGGSYRITKYKIEKEFDKDDSITCVSAKCLKKNDWFAGAACMFPPSAMTEKTDMTTPLINVYSSMEKWCVSNSKIIDRFKNCKEFNYFHPLEVGASNTAMPIIALAKINKEQKKDIKIIDADTAGRSIPTLPLIVFSAYQKNKNISWFPNYVASKTIDSSYYNTGQFQFTTGSEIEDAFITLIMNQFDACGGFSVFPMNGKTLKNNPSVDGTLVDSYNVGKIFEDDKLSREEVCEKIVKYFNKVGRKSKIIFSGILDEIVMEQTGTDNGSIIIKGTKKDKGYILELRVSNENIFAYKYKQNGKKKDIYILGPDSMCAIPLDKSIDIADNSDLINYFNCPSIDKIELSILGVTAPKVVYDIVKNDKNNILLKNWISEWSQLGYNGKEYIQPWLK